MPLLRQSPDGVGGDVGTGLVDDADHAERHPHLTKLEPVGKGVAADDLAHRVAEAGDVAEPVGHARDPRAVEAQPVDDRLGRAGGAGPLDVAGVGREDALTLFLQCRRHRLESRVLGGAGARGEVDRRLAGPAGGVEDGVSVRSVDAVLSGKTSHVPILGDPGIATSFPSTGPIAPGDVVPGGGFGGGFGTSARKNTATLTVLDDSDTMPG